MAKPATTKCDWKGFPLSPAINWETQTIDHTCTQNLDSINTEDMGRGTTYTPFP